MKAAILWEQGRALEVRDDVALLDLASDDVHIQVVSSGVCRSDLSAQQGITPTPTPCVLGHEAAGIVREVGTHVSDLASRLEMRP